MKKQYIKLPTLAEAYALAEANGYERDECYNYKREDGLIVRCREDGECFSSTFTEEECIEEGYTKLEPPTTEEAKNVLQVGQEVWVDDVSEKNARKDKHTRKLIAILPEGYKGRYIATKDGIAWARWEYAVPVEKEEERERIVGVLEEMIEQERQNTWKNSDEAIMRMICLKQAQEAIASITK